MWDYFRNSWEGEDGKFSYRRFSQYIFLGLVMFLVITGQTNNQYGFYTMITLITVWLLVTAIITVQQLIILLKFTMPFKRLRYENDTYEDPLDDPDLRANPDGVQSTQVSDGIEVRTVTSPGSPAPGEG